MIVFALTGLWHGASWTFVVWGLWHCLFRIIEKIAQKKGLTFKYIPPVFKHIVTMLIVMIGWVLFRADTLEYAVGYIGRLFGLNNISKIYYLTGYYLDPYKLFIIVTAIIFSCSIVPKKLNDKVCESVLVRNIVAVLLLLLSIIYVMNATYNPFIYFRF